MKYELAPRAILDVQSKPRSKSAKYVRAIHWVTINQSQTGRQRYIPMLSRWDYRL
jgi:hypothetical protein